MRTMVASLLALALGLSANVATAQQTAAAARVAPRGSGSGDGYALPPRAAAAPAGMPQVCRAVDSDTQLCIREAARVEAQAAADRAMTSLMARLPPSGGVAPTPGAVPTAPAPSRLVATAPRAAPARPNTCSVGDEDCVCRNRGGIMLSDADGAPRTCHSQSAAIRALNTRLAYVDQEARAARESVAIIVNAVLPTEQATFFCGLVAANPGLHLQPPAGTTYNCASSAVRAAAARRDALSPPSTVAPTATPAP